MNQEELTKTFLMILNFQNPLISMGYTKIFTHISLIIIYNSFFIVSIRIRIMLQRTTKMMSGQRLLVTRCHV